MLLTITTTHQPATDLGYLLYKNPARTQIFPPAQKQNRWDHQRFGNGGGGKLNRGDAKTQEVANDSGNPYGTTVSDDSEE